MDVQVKNTDELNAILTIKINNDDYKDKYESSLKKYKKDVQLPGFRKGHIPASIIKKKYGASILAEEIDKLLNDTLYKHITENKINILGNPMPKVDKNQEIDWKNPSDFEFEYEIGLAPEFNLELPGKDKYTYHKLKIDDKLINKQIEDFAKRYGKLSSVEISEDKDMIMAEFNELDENDKIVEGGFNKSSTVSIEFVDVKKAKDKLIGLKVGDEHILNPKEISKGDVDMASMLGIEKEAAISYTNNVKFTVKEINRLQPANIDQGLYDKIFGEGVVETEEQFREKIANDLSGMFDKDSERIFKKNVSKQLMDKLKLDLPNDFLKRWILATNKDANQELIDKEYHLYADNLKWQLIENKIIKQEDIKVENQEIIEHTKELLASQYGQYGMMIPPDEELEKAAKNVLSNQEETKKIYDMIYDKKVTTYLKETLKTTNKELSYDDFVKFATETLGQ